MIQSNRPTADTSVESTDGITSSLDNFIPVIPVDHLVHTDEHPFCDDPTCYCHEDASTIAIVQQQVTDGLLTSTEATRTVQGKQIRRQYGNTDLFPTV